MDVARACHDKGIKSVAVTAAYVYREPRKEFYRYMYVGNVDLKAFTDDYCQKITGLHLAPVLRTLGKR